MPSGKNQLKGSDIAKVFGTQDNFNMLKGLLNQKGPGALNDAIRLKQKQTQAIPVKNGKPVIKPRTDYIKLAASMVPTPPKIGQPKMQQ